MATSNKPTTPARDPVMLEQLRTALTVARGVAALVAGLQNDLKAELDILDAAVEDGRIPVLREPPPQTTEETALSIRNSRAYGEDLPLDRMVNFRRDEILQKGTWQCGNCGKRLTVSFPDKPDTADSQPRHRTSPTASRRI